MPAAEREGAAFFGALMAGGALVAAGAFAAWLLYERLWLGSITALVIAEVVFVALGGYGGWLLGLVVYSTVRGGSGTRTRQNRS